MALTFTDLEIWRRFRSEFDCANVIPWAWGWINLEFISLMFFVISTDTLVSVLGQAERHSNYDQWWGDGDRERWEEAVYHSEKTSDKKSG